MANDDQVSALGGLRPVTQPYGNIKRSYYKLTTSASIDCFIGTPMDLDTNGQATYGSQGTGITKLLVGPVIGFAQDSRGQMGLPSAVTQITQGAYLPRNTDAYVCIADDPNQEFIIQEASTGTALTAGAIGNSTGFIFMTTRDTVQTGSGSFITGSSHAELLPGTASALTTGTLRIVGLADNMNSDGSYNAVGAYAKWRVRISNHRLVNPQATGIQ